MTNNSNNNNSSNNMINSKTTTLATNILLTFPVPLEWVFEMMQCVRAPTPCPCLRVPEVLGDTVPLLSCPPIIDIYNITDERMS